MGRRPAATYGTVTNSEAPTSILSPGIRPITIGILLAMGLVAFDTLSVITMVPAITADLGEVELISWIITAFLLMSTITILIAGPAVDRWGLRVTFRVSLVVLIGSSIAAAVAPTMELLILARAGQGIGGGASLTVSVAAIGIAIPPALRPRSYAANAAVWGVASLAGPGVAAAFISVASWRLVFLVNVPLGLVAFLFSLNHLPGRLPPASREQRLDLRGLLLIGAFTALVLVGLADFSRWTVLALGLALSLAATYWWHSGRTSHPVLRRDHVIGMPIGVLNFLGFGAFAAVLAVVAYTSLFVEGSLGLGTGYSGLAVAFTALGWMFGSIAASRLQDRMSGYSVITGGLALVLVALIFGMVSYGESRPLALVLVGMLTIGLGVGAFSNAQLTTLQSLTVEEEMGRISSSSQYLRSLGNTYGTAAAGALILFEVGRRVGDTEQIRDLLAGEEVALADAARRGLAAGYRLAHVLATVLAVAVLIGSAVLRSRLAEGSTRFGSVDDKGRLR